MTVRTACALLITLSLYALLPGCESGNQAVDAAGLAQVSLRIEGMT